ncbi:kinase-like domain-containing protein [Mucor mucedo]|uniref:kinase-like domain-containing protein n=1 Tax=Mucor mucedo TaxID=29922 RepID=UPI00222013B5|nr:kinase-like domain-containing protein [Mucor mucedo]KAI7891443.1 kinase-like domain-containing protein [Mucor mucedo]
MRTLNHPSVIKMLDFIETKEYFFLVLELMDGGEIFHQIVQLTYFSEDLSRHCIRQVAEGIRYLHEERGVVHRDIKPENILFQSIPFMERKSTTAPTVADEEEEKEDEGEFVVGQGGGGIGRVKLADFGLSKVVWDKHTMTPCGTVGYTAPEIVRDERYSKSVDMWALGCVLYTMLCGFPPFYDESISTLTQKVAKGHYTFLSPWWDHISEEAKHLVKHLLNINPKKRYTIDQFLAHPWMKTSEEPTVMTTTAGSPAILNPPSTTTSVAVETISITPSSTTPSQTIPIAASGKNHKRKDLFMSGISSMKEVFDVSYAVHRMGEERAQRKENKKKPVQETSRLKVFHAPLNDDDDEEEEEEMVQDDSSNTSSSDDNIDSLCTHLEDAQIKKKPNDNLLIKKLAGRLNDAPPVVNRKAKKSFELNMGKATLLGRRKNVPTL